MSNLNKKQMLEMTPELIDLLKTTDDVIYFIPEEEDVSDDESMFNEYNLLGYFVTKHPLDDFKNRMNQLEKINNLNLKSSGSKIHVGGIISSIRPLRTKKGDDMATLMLEDTSGRVDVVIFPKMYAQFKHLLKANNLIEIKGKLEIEEREVNEETVRTPKITGNLIFPLEQVKDLKEIVLRIRETDSLEEIKETLIQNRGAIPISIDYECCRMETPYKMSHKKEAIDKLRNLVLTYEVENKTQ